MMHRLRVLFSTGLISLSAAFLLLFSSCGSGAPPVSIQAPVGSLIALNGPDVNGNVTISGAAGSVQANATVIASNPPAGIAFRWRWQDIFLRSAFAQATEVSTTADAAGAFSLVIAATNCDSIGIRQVVGENTSAETIVQVPGTGCPPPLCPPVDGGGTVPFGGACDDDLDCSNDFPCVNCSCI